MSFLLTLRVILYANSNNTSWDFRLLLVGTSGSLVSPNANGNNSSLAGLSRVSHAPFFQPRPPFSRVSPLPQLLLTLTLKPTHRPLPPLQPSEYPSYTSLYFPSTLLLLAPLSLFLTPFFLPVFPLLGLSSDRSTRL